MSLLILSAELVEAIHDSILNTGELQGRAQDKSLEGALARVDNRLVYGMIEDVFDLASAYAAAISQGHCFNDCNKRTAHQSMDVCLDINGVQIIWNTEEVGQMIIQLAQGLLNEDDMAAWLLSQTS
ncbi:type II toxin-antitoxin system death-on-curing family toxin [Roseovarius phycicola]|uniref:Type II toxin-antitoxin system death-on-curing family toxin n=1 Tax=Roseovarius phycicola TaxID=3080976 RepID=A0ABZ2HLR3_9RHOB